MKQSLGPAAPDQSAGAVNLLLMMGHSLSLTVTPAGSGTVRTLKTD